ncbi:Hypothetical predicted protein [Pelobates cultripes]|uniref:Helix-turn-helix domain-containing protein n=1 Tax=Pelobates cultripes TaxID=61616 RepID=A0AAD1VLQ5_PELCU|nr:Hypothetical predicted protein [Pelobates cultripes]
MTSNIDDKSVQFLDVEILIINHKLEYKHFTKPTDCNTILHFESFHPRHLKESLPYSQFLKVLRNNSQSQQCDQQLKIMYQKFQSRGYQYTILDDAMTKAKIAFSSLPTQIMKVAKTRPIFPMQFNTASSELTKSIRHNWNILELGPTLPEELCQRPMFCYRRNRNLRDLLVKTDPQHCYSPIKKESKNAGCVRCLGCVTCGHIIPSKTFSHPYTGKIQHRIHCRTEFVIFKLTCPCGLNYIGKTEMALCERIKGPQI